MGGYAAGYYAYIWSEVLDANTTQWIKDNGGLKRENGDRFRDTLLSRGGSKDASQLFVDFTGHEPDIQPLLVKRGLVEAPEDGAPPVEAPDDERKGVVSGKSVSVRVDTGGRSTYKKKKKK